MTPGLTVETLRDCLAGLPPLELLGMRLMQACPLPADVPRETVKQAVIEIIEYTERCQQAAHRLSRLSPVPLRSVEILEYAL